MRILLVEDHASTLQILAVALRRKGHRVTPVGTMRAALDAVHEGGHDVMVCDIGLPDGDGWQLLETVRMRCGIPAVAMSAYGAPTDLARSLAAGYALHLVKPFDPDELYAAIDGLMPAVAGMGE
jgi:two-component system CheB/CheR fusion protein